MLCQEPRAIKGFGYKYQWVCQVEQKLAMSASSVLPEVKACDIAFSFGSIAWIHRFLLEILVKTRPLK
jgi:hypothetical protein